MPRKKVEKPPEPIQEKSTSTRTQKPAMTPEGRERQLTSLAYNLAEKQLTDGTASPSVIGHFLKLASKREYLEQEILEKQKTLIEAKANSIHKDREVEELVKSAMNAMNNYRPSEQ